jgi:hypothetical protein
MLESYFSYRGVLKRLRDGALGAEMDRIAGHFFSLGYKQASAKLYLSRIARPFFCSALRFTADRRSYRRWLSTHVHHGLTADCGSVCAPTRATGGARTIHCLDAHCSR